ncbi:MAG: transcriptional regulator [Candidatus Thorarchaeota archaeon]|nr:MAG: transcriptional regulator [Candidatus Thorarchaeota archaeon]
MSTRRQEIENLLKQTDVPLTAQEIRERLKLESNSIVNEDLEHIARSVRIEGRELLIKPASCAKCGYTFTSRSSAKKPSKCPKCKSEWIIEPRFIIEPRG